MPARSNSIQQHKCAPLALAQSHTRVRSPQITYLSHQQRGASMVSDSRENAAYYRIAEHYRFVLGTLFDCFEYPRVIILEVAQPPRPSHPCRAVIALARALGRPPRSARARLPVGRRTCPRSEAGSCLLRRGLASPVCGGMMTRCLRPACQGASQ